MLDALSIDIATISQGNNKDLNPEPNTHKIQNLHQHNMGSHQAYYNSHYYPQFRKWERQSSRAGMGLTMDSKLVLLGWPM